MGRSVGGFGISVFFMLSIAFCEPGLVLAQAQTVELEMDNERHDQDDALLDVKLKLDDFVSALSSVRLGYDCNKSQRRVQQANFRRKFGRRIDLVFEKLRAFGPDVASHGHDIIGIERCRNLPGSGGALPANARQFEASLTGFENFFAQRKAN